jgi:glycosyltransferase involved in cell wall biosynthesis
VDEPPLRILFAAPAWWPSRAFGGPIPVARELVRRLVERGHSVDVVTTTIVDLHGRPAGRTSVAEVDGATVRYLSTPVRYRWMGITPGLPLALRRLPRPDVGHVFGFRDPVTTGTAAWLRAKRIPYVFEPLGMFHARLRKVRLKRTLDATLYRGVARGAAAVVVSSERERDGVVAGGVPSWKVRVRGNGFPEPGVAGATDDLRARLGIPPQAPLAVGEELRDAHVVLSGPDDRHGVAALVRRAEAGGRVHALPPTPEPPLDLYPQADVFVLASEGESFGMAAAEAAAAGTPVVVSDRCGIAPFFADGEALVVPYERSAVVDAVRSVLTDADLRRRLSRGGVEAARRTSWDHVTDVQEEIYRAVASRTAATNASTDGS